MRNRSSSPRSPNWFGHEGSIVPYVFWHSIALACLVGMLVILQAYVPPFTGMVY
jgi:lactate permease